MVSNVRMPRASGGPMFGVMVGYALFLVWFEGTKSFDVGSVTTDPASTFALCTLATDMVLLVLAACLYRTVVTLRARRPVVMAAACLIAPATCGVLLPSAGVVLPVPVAGFLGVLMGGARSVLTMAWMESFCRYGMRDACIAFACSTVVGAVLSMVSDFVLPTVANVLFDAGAGVACAVLVGRTARAEEDDADAERRGDGVRGETPVDTVCAAQAGACTVNRWTFPLQPTVLMAVYAAATLLAVNLSDPTVVSIHHGASSALAAAALLAMALVRAERLDIRVLVGVAAPLGCLGLLGAMSGFWGFGVPVAFVARLGYQCFSLFTYVLLFNISYRYGVNPLWLFGFSRAPRVVMAIAVPMIIGTGLLEPCTPQADAVLAATLVVLVAVTCIPSVGKSFNTTWGIRPRDEGPRAENPAELPLEERCSRASFAFGLTRREEEVLVLLVRGMNAPDIERELLISNGTVRNHIQHVYKKLGVHSREELQAKMVDPRFGKG